MATIGTIKEIKDQENRVGLTPGNVQELVKKKHRVFVEKGAGRGTGFSDDQYQKAGAMLVATPQEVAKKSDILVKVKEPQQSEYPLLALLKGKTLYTYLHLAAADPQLTKELVKNNVFAIGYETVQDEKGKLPLLKPMSEVAGVLAVQYGAQYLQKKYKGRGMTLGIIEGTPSAKVLVMGAGIVGSTSARTAAGMGAKVTIMDINEKRLKELKVQFKKKMGPLGNNLKYVKSSQKTIEKELQNTDLLIGAVLVAGAKAPQVISEEQIGLLPDGAVIMDVAIDQGGCIWGSRPTSHSNPIYELKDKIYCCVTNMPSQAARQSTMALTAATFPYLVQMADKGAEAYCRKNKNFAKGVNVFDGKIACREVAAALNMNDTFKEFI